MDGTEANIIQWLNQPWGRMADALMFAASAIGEWGVVWWGVCAALALLGGTQGRRMALFIAAAIILSVAIDALIKTAWFRPRPYMVLQDIRQIGRLWADSSLPSGHASSSAAATIILARFDRRAGIAAAIYTLLSCFSRPYLGMHWPSDVLGGLGTGIVAALLVLGIGRLIARARSPA